MLLLIYTPEIGKYVSENNGANEKSLPWVSHGRLLTRA
jgi:hypothetical protein